MLIFILLFITLIILFRVVYLLFIRSPTFKTKYKRYSTNKEKHLDGKVKTIVVLGSGGHTTEMLMVVSLLDPNKYYKYYVIASSDKRSYDRVIQAESSLTCSDYELVYIPRSREVAQPWLSSVITTLIALFVCMFKMLHIRPHAVLCNGPGTCVPVVFTAWLLQVLCLARPRIVFIESLCRVKSLSLSGKILRFFTDEFLVQWPELKQRYPDTHYIGRL